MSACADGCNCSSKLKSILEDIDNPKPKSKHTRKRNFRRKK